MEWAWRGGHLFLSLVLASMGLGCRGDLHGDPSAAPVPASSSAEPPRATAFPEPGEDWGRDLVSTRIHVDIETKVARATVRFAPSSSPAASLDVRGLEVTGVDGDLRIPTFRGPIPYRIRDGRLDLGLPPGAEGAVTIAYRYRIAAGMKGALDSGATFLWPHHCGNLYPCKTDPADGFTFELDVTGVPRGKTAVFAPAIETAAPAYMLAWAVGEYRHRVLGTTAAGTRVGVWWLAGAEDEKQAIAGTARLARVFDWYERTLGPYAFGKEVGSVAVDWRGGGFGGMEHHPFWHLAREAMGDELTHAHEAAHGWFGNGVRLRCWEDFVLSEGTASYLSAKALEELGGADEGRRIWKGYQAALRAALRRKDRVAWPASCGKVDVIADGLYTEAVYMKGAFFLRAVERAVGAGPLLSALSRFYKANVGKAAGIEDMLAAIRDETGHDPGALADRWLRGLGLPDLP